MGKKSTAFLLGLALWAIWANIEPVKYVGSIIIVFMIIFALVSD